MKSHRIGLFKVFAAIVAARQSGSKEFVWKFGVKYLNNTLVSKKLSTEDFNVTRAELNAKMLGM